MCGIVGYTGSRKATPLLFEGLRTLEYRGYDSSGVAVQANAALDIRKSLGRLDALGDVLNEQPVGGSTGIGHTRWATHGEPALRNAHPHLDGGGDVAVVHNGIIENYQSLRAGLESDGVVFASDTDTEVIPHLLAREFASCGQMKQAVLQTLTKLEGAYALGIVSRYEPEVLYAARLGSPLIIGVGEGEHFIASDVPAIIREVQRVIYLEDGQVARLTPQSVELCTIDGLEVIADIRETTLQAEEVDRAGFDTFMMKEIHEQPRVLRSLLDKYIDENGMVALKGRGLDASLLTGIDRVMVISCGTAYYAGFYGKLLIEHLTGYPVEVDLASEFRYRSPKIDEHTLIIAVSQSGETADTLASVRMARSKGCKLLSICNVDGSSLVRESDAVFFTEAGPEIGVASTKAYTSQQMAFVFIALAMGQYAGDIDDETVAEYCDELERIPSAILHVINRAEHIRHVAEKHCDGPSALYLGRRFNYPTALEGALKNKEISYQHAEAYAAGEMKHGPIALINEYLPVVCICTKTADCVYEKVVSNMKEVEARRGRIIAIATDGDEVLEALAEDIIFVPEMREELSPLVNVVALQLLAYYEAQARGNDIDKPRNLAKSVTVE